MEEQELLYKLRQALRGKAIRLWEPPYTDSATKAPAQGELAALAASLALELRVQPADTAAARCRTALEKLRLQSLENADSAEHFRATHEATLKVRLPRGHQPQVQKIRCSLQATAYQLKSLLVSQTQGELDLPCISLICNGQVLDDALSLGNQGVQNASNLMLLVRAAPADVRSLRADADDADALRQAEEEARLLADGGGGGGGGGNGEDDGPLDLTNQRGERLNVPREGRQSLYYAMILGEKGKAALRSGDHGRALLLLLAGDQAFRRCDSRLLDSVDNQALLQLDIVWCYLCLGRLDELADAWDRLGLAERALTRAYGERLERVEAVKGTSAGGERLHLLRLHLLKGVCHFYSNQHEEALSEARLATSELDRLAVDDAGLSRLMEMGFGLLESRLAMRHCANNAEAAIEWIVAKRERHRLQAAERRLQRRLGCLDDGSTPVSAEACLRLTEMGFLQAHAHEALVLARNDLDAALALLQDDQERLQTLADRRYNSRLQLVLDMAAAAGVRAKAERFAPRLAAKIGARLEAYSRPQQQQQLQLQQPSRAQRLLISCLDDLLEDEGAAATGVDSGASGGGTSASSADGAADSVASSWTTESSGGGGGAEAAEEAKQVMTSLSAARETTRRQREALEKLRDEVGEQQLGEADAYLDSDLREERRHLDRLLEMLGAK